jgi:recombination protein RecR
LNYPSKLVEEAVLEIAKLPGIGKKSALRLVLHFLKSGILPTQKLTFALENLVKNTINCSVCFSIADEELCNVCSNGKRDKRIMAVVADTRDLMAIENTNQYNGVYHVLGGVISPIQGIGPSELKIEKLIERLSQDAEIKEIILALSPTMEGDTTAFYIKKRIEHLNLKISTIARGIPIGGDLEYTDEITLGRSILTRVSF